MKDFISSIINLFSTVGSSSIINFVHNFQWPRSDNQSIIQTMHSYKINRIKVGNLRIILHKKTERKITSFMVFFQFYILLLYMLEISIKKK